MRLPGTVNVLDAKKRSRGRQPALAYCVRFDDHEQGHDADALLRNVEKHQDTETHSEDLSRTHGSRTIVRLWEGNVSTFPDG
jgi:hypothetical protein